ncbi:MAG: tRNA (adenosine(37)-N6)-threonylcarbamoyltransferase complex ATPase subunit type 1 TsaE [Candidatus Shapirobacteria bacterium]|jgi:tRNA threonylcarbamoyladenosine biosynthesis protein TsaE
MKYVSGSEKDTFNFAKKFAKTLKGGEAIGLIGDLGAGKTVFAKGLAAGLGIKQKITSPTFVLMRVYPVKKVRIKNFIHIDAYRLKSAADLEAIGAKEYFSDPVSVILIEWADRVKKMLPKKIKYININSINERRIIIY